MPLVRVARLVIGEIVLVLAQILRVPIVVGLVERGAVEREIRVILLQLVGPVLQALVFFPFGFARRALQSYL